MMKNTGYSSLTKAQKKALFDLFKFLKENHSHNHAFQLISLKSSVLPFKTNKEKIKSLLIDAANTQSMANMDILEPLWSRIAEENEATFSSAGGFANFLMNEAKKSEKKPYSKEYPTDLLEIIFFSLCMIPGFGEKTAALFVKNLIYLHHKNKDIGYKEESFQIWKDKGLQCIDSDKIYVPVDAVIEHIFDGTGVGSNFKSINKSLHAFMTEESMIDMVYWDDLWYWGFFTQYVKTVENVKVRYDEINKSKFMTWKNSSFDSYKTAKKIANVYFGILKKLRPLKKMPRQSMAKSP